MASELYMQHPSWASNGARLGNVEIHPVCPGYFSVRLVALISGSKIWSATCENLGTGQSMLVALKLARGPTEMAILQQEARLYNHLRHLQGLILPACYGYFEGQLSHGFSIGCMLLEYLDPLESSKVNSDYR
jgi:hypothetical protein